MSKQVMSTISTPKNPPRDLLCSSHLPSRVCQKAIRDLLEVYTTAAQNGRTWIPESLHETNCLPANQQCLLQILCKRTINFKKKKKRFMGCVDSIMDMQKTSTTEALRPRFNPNITISPGWAVLWSLFFFLYLSRLKITLKDLFIIREGKYNSTSQFWQEVVLGIEHGASGNSNTQAGVLTG